MALKTMGEIVPKLLTATLATTPTSQPMESNQKFADWLGYQTLGDPELEKVVLACREWSAAFKQRGGDNPRTPRWLSLLGVSDTGKTHCARKLWQWAHDVSDWTRTEFTPKPIYWPGFVQTLRAGEGFKMRDDMRKWPVLFLDDIGAERDLSGFAAEELNTLLNYRLDKWTLITSNKGVDELKVIDLRIASRLIRGNNICVGIDTKGFNTR